MRKSKIKSYYIASNPTLKKHYRGLVKKMQEEINRKWINDDLAPKEIARRSGLCTSTVTNHRKYRTSSPQVASLMALAEALDFELVMGRKTVGEADKVVNLDAWRKGAKVGRPRLIKKKLKRA